MVKVTHEEFMDFVRKYNRRVPETEAEILIDRIIKGKKMTNEEYLLLMKDVERFMESDASEEDKRRVGGYTEMLGMICSAIKEGLM